MAQSFCTECGSPLDGAFCTECGTPAAAAAPPAPPAPVIPPPPPVDLYGPPTGVLPPATRPVAVVTPATPAPKARSRKPLVLGSAAAALLLVGGGIGAAVLLGGDDEKDPAKEPVAGAQIQPVNSLLGEPGREWTVTAAELADDPEASFSGVTWNYEQSLPLYLDGLVVVQTYSEYADQAVYAFDTATGEEAWNIPLGEGEDLSCRAADDLEHFICRRSTYIEGEDSTYSVQVRDARNGEVVGETDVRTDGWVSDFLIDGDATYFLVTDYDYEAGVYDGTLTSGTFQDPDGGWSTDFHELMPQDESGEYYDRVMLESGRLKVNLGQWEYDVDPADGDATEIPVEDGDAWVIPVGDAEVTQTWDDVLDEYNSTWSDDGHVLNFRGDVWRDLDYTARPHGDLVGFGGGIYDVTSGELVTAFPDTDYAGAWLADDTVLLDMDDADDDEYGDDYEVRDAITGELLWYPGRRPDLSTDDAAVSISTDTASLTVRDLRSGSDMWQRDISDELTLGDDGSYYGSAWPHTDEAGMTVMLDKALLGYADFPKRAPRLPTTYDGDASGTTVTEEDEEIELGTDYVTACGSEPVFTPVVAVGDSGGVEVSFSVSATCEGGQWLDSSAYRITMTGDEGQTLAQGLFDFSDDPVWVNDSDEVDARTTVQSYFPVGQVWSTPEEIQRQIDGEVIEVPCTDESGESGSGDSLAPADPAYTDEDDAEPAEVDEVVTAEEREENSLAALRRLKREDAPYVSDWVGRWVPQVSSKTDGTKDDGIEYDYTAIYENHLQLALRYPDVRLLWSSDWNFQVPRLWVTVVGLPEDDYQPVLDWCDAQGIGLSDCAAKRLRPGGPWKGNTKWRPGTFD